MSADVSTQSQAKSLAHASEPDAIYQGGRVVGRVFDGRVDTAAREIRFGEIYNSDELLLPDDCEFLEYRILIQRMDFATREERGAAHKGRVLRGVVAEILGYREQ
jgi:hypothetical protein